MPRAKIEPLDPATFNEKKRAFLDRLPQSNLTLGQTVKQMRLLLGMTQEEYAQRIVGRTRKTVSAIENDKHNPELATLKKIGAPFGLNVGFVKPN